MSLTNMTYASNWFIFALTFLMRSTVPVLTKDPIIYACSGDSIPLFQGIAIDNPEIHVSLVINGSTTRTIAAWTHNETTISNGYSRKVLLEKCGNVRILNITLSDEAKYVLFRKTETDVNTTSVYLTVLVSPSRSCKPILTHLDHALSASVESTYCGRPVVSAYWLHYPNVQYESKDFIKLPNKTNAGTYYACIEGPAVSCAKNSTFVDYCSWYTVENNIIEASLESSPSQTWSPLFMIGMGSIAAVCIVILVTIIVISYRKRKLSLKGTGEAHFSDTQNQTRFVPENDTNGSSKIVDDNTSGANQNVDDTRMGVRTDEDKLF